MAAQHPSVRAPWPVLAHKRRPGKKQEAKTCTFSFDLGSILSSLRPLNRHLIVTFEDGMWNLGQLKAEYPQSPNEGRVAHISLVFREMWDTTDVEF